VAREQSEYARGVVRRDGPSFAAELDRLLALYDPDVTAVMLNLLGSHDTPRLRTVLGGDSRAVRLAMLLVMTLPGAPCIYYGDDLGMGGHHDPDNRRAYPVGPPDAEGAGLHGFVREAVWLRRRHRALRDGTFEVVGAAGEALAYLRRADGESFLVAVNAGDRPTELPIRAAVAGADLRHVLATEAGPSAAFEMPDERDWLVVRVPARAGVVARVEVAGI
jgi:neopullulanase